MDAFAHFSVIEGEGFRVLTAGERVEFDYDPARQDGFRFRATRVRQL
jgi:CspA family cold shock protein